MPRRPPVFVHLLPSLIPPGALKGGVAVVTDVLRATTTMIHALAAGAEAVVPCLEVDEARRVAAGFPDGSALLAGERQGLPIDGFDLGNSPASCTPEVCAGKTLVMTTTNGTRAILASLEADRVLIAAFVNREATLGALEADGRPIHLVCSGTNGLVSLEDSLFAGSIASEWESRARREAEPDESRVDEARVPTLEDDQALLASASWREVQVRILEGSRLASILGEGQGGRRVREIGLGPDLEDAATLDRFPFAAELLRDPSRIVPVGDGPRLRLFGAP